MSSFHNPGSTLDLSASRIGPEGVRRAQLGAICGIGAHFTLHPEEVAQVVLPTGVGKTLVLTAAPYLLDARRVLVVAPTRVLRDQLVEAFSSLGDLKRSGVLPDGVAAPSISIAARRVKTDATWETLAENEVVVGTVHAVSSGYGAQSIPDTVAFDVAIFDEAHHLPASTWTTLLQQLPSDCRCIATTATPFRRDRRRIPGRVAFSYPLSQAIADRVFAPVEFVPVELDQRNDPARSIAEAAVALMTGEVHATAESQLLVRADRVEEAKRLESLYSEELAFPVRLIHEGTSSRQVRKILRALDDGELRGLVCVGALIEGFNRPRLKVGAYHSPHQSLAPTLQFLGRLARVGTPAPAQLLAVRDQVTGEAQNLYDEDRSWSVLVPELVDRELGEQQALREFLDRATARGTPEIAAESITPARSARILRVPAGTDPAMSASVDQLEGRQVIRDIYDETSHLRCLVTRRTIRPRWIQADALDSPEFECHLIKWAPEHRLLFVGSDHGGVARALLQKLGVEHAAHKLAEHEIARLLGRQHVERYFSVGAHETAPSRIATTTYEMAAGGRVDAGLDPIRSRGQRLGHAMGRGSAEGTFGLSVRKSKWWEPEPTTSLLDFASWCDACARDLATPDVDSLPGLPFAMARPFETFPLNPLAAVGAADTLVWTFVNGDALPLVALEMLCESREDRHSLRLSLCRETKTVWEGEIDTHGTVRSTSPGSLVDLEGEIHAVADALTDHPPTIVFGDGSTIIGQGHQPAVGPDLGPLPADLLAPRDWSGTDIHAEFRDPREGLETIFATVASWLSVDLGARFVLCDHDPGELADFVAVRPEPDGTCLVELVHCKSLPRQAAEPRAQMTDIEGLLQQSTRSVRWNVPGSALWQDLVRRRARGRATVDVGDDTECDTLLAQFVGDPPPIHLTIHAVQPGLAASRVDSWINGRTLLHAANSWIRQMHGQFTVHCSP